eukprot:1156538-Pelagomonas_calceolata.AAC.3
MALLKASCSRGCSQSIRENGLQLHPQMITYCDIFVLFPPILFKGTYYSKTAFGLPAQKREKAPCSVTAHHTKAARSIAIAHCTMIAHHIIIAAHRKRKKSL